MKLNIYKQNLAEYEINTKLTLLTIINKVNYQKLDIEKDFLNDKLTRMIKEKRT